ncbi:alpha/beta fold hydrolase [Mycolicibacterium houstonense]|uniref:alpha/beta fold hydrolase n=1 Tax=Mycolicibacterium houstonense TaxID=146021 RepID=UPI000A975ECE|nr:alpha/beta hydrolase [Mycolicibacterium houstonense]
MTVGRAAYAGYETRELSVTGDGPKVILLHGFAHPADSWQAILQRCTAAGIPAVAADLPGFGAADPFHPGPRLPQLDRFVEEMVDRHGIPSSAVVVGNSLGGLLAVRAAARSGDDRVGAVMPVNAAGFGWTPAGRVLACAAGRRLGWLGAAPAPAPVLRHLSDRIARYGLYGDKQAAVDPAMIHLLTDQLQLPAQRRHILALAREIVTEVNSVRVVPVVRCPTTVVHGRVDPIVSLAASRRLATAIDGAQLNVLDNAGHCPQLDAPDLVFAALQNLVRVVRGTMSA